MDLSGPHPASFAGHRYFLAANLSVEDGEDIPVSRLLFTKKTEEVARAAAGALLLHAQLPLHLWSEAILEATFLRRSRALKLLIPKDRPKMGDSVLARKPPLSVEHPFEPRAEEGVFMANDERTPGGARIMVVRDGATSVRVVRTPALKDKPTVRLSDGSLRRVLAMKLRGLAPRATFDGTRLFRHDYC